LIKNSQPFGENVRKTQGGIFLTRAVCRYDTVAMVRLRLMVYVCYCSRQRNEGSSLDHRSESFTSELSAFHLQKPPSIGCLCLPAVVSYNKLYFNFVAQPILKRDNFVLSPVVGRILTYVTHIDDWLHI